MGKGTLTILALFIATLAHAGPNTIFVRGFGASGTLIQSQGRLTKVHDTGWERWEVGDALGTVGLLRSMGIEAVPDAKVEALVDPNDQLEPQGWHWLQTASTWVQGGGFPGVDVDAHQAWDIWTGDSTFRIGMIDSGIQFDHEDLVGNIWQNYADPVDGIDNDGNGFVDDWRGWDFGGEVYGANPVIEDNDPTDRFFHGTFTSGIAGARTNNGIGVSGAMWNCKLVPLKYSQANTGSGWFSSCIEAMEYARHAGIKITNNSYGGNTPFQPLADEIALCTAAGMLTICAAGNSASDQDCACNVMANNYPASFSDPGIISVGASDPHDYMAWFSNYGRYSVDVFAPGYEILSTNLYTVGGCETIQCKYVVVGGTSAACPVVSGLAGLIWSRRPDWTAAQVKACILGTVELKPAFTDRCVTGGRVNFYQALQQAASGGGGGQQETTGITPGHPANPATSNKTYDVQGRRVDPAQRSGITFKPGQKRAVVK